MVQWRSICSSAALRPAVFKRYKVWCAPRCTLQISISTTPPWQALKMPDVNDDLSDELCCECWWKQSKRRLVKQRETLNEAEAFWRDKQPFLAARGYTLRARLHPGWQPSWKSDPEKIPVLCDDFGGGEWYPSERIDACRESDGRFVFIQKVSNTSPESEIVTQLSSSPLSADPCNPCPPLLDSFPDEENREISYIVMPHLREFRDPPFTRVSEVLDFAEQVLEGLAFLHEHEVALNMSYDGFGRAIMMDASALYPQGYDPAKQYYLPGSRKWAPYRSRSDAPQPVRYHFVDFSKAVRSSLHTPQLLYRKHADHYLGPDCPPHMTEPYDPMKHDVEQVGIFLERDIVDRYHLRYLEGLVDAMSCSDADQRITARDALLEFRRIRSSLWRVQERAGLESWSCLPLLKALFWPTVYCAVYWLVASYVPVSVHISVRRVM